MITQDLNKKQLVEKLLQDKHISLDDALLLLENDELEETGKQHFGPFVPDGFSQPHNFPIPGTFVYDGTSPITVLGADKTITLSTGNPQPLMPTTTNYKVNFNC